MCVGRMCGKWHTDPSTWTEPCELLQFIRTLETFNQILQQTKSFQTKKINNCDRTHQHKFAHKRAKKKKRVKYIEIAPKSLISD